MDWMNSVETDMLVEFCRDVEGSDLVKRETTCEEWMKKALVGVCTGGQAQEHKLQCVRLDFSLASGTFFILKGKGLVVLASSPMSIDWNVRLEQLKLLKCSECMYVIWMGEGGRCWQALFGQWLTFTRLSLAAQYHQHQHHHHHVSQMEAGMFYYLEVNRRQAALTRHEVPWLSDIAAHYYHSVVASIGLVSRLAHSTVTLHGKQLPLSCCCWCCSYWSCFKLLLFASYLAIIVNGCLAGATHTSTHQVLICCL